MAGTECHCLRSEVKIIGKLLRARKQSFTLAMALDSSVCVGIWYE